MMGRGVAAGASMPYHAGSSAPCTPDSASVGTCGNSGMRFGVAMPSARTRPARRNGNWFCTESNATVTSPATRADAIGAPPLYGTCVIFVAVCNMKSSIAICAKLAGPNEPYGS